MTRSGCPSAVRSTGRCPLISAKRGIGHTNSSQFRDGVNSLKRSGPNFVREGVAETATPTATPPQRGRRMPGLELARKAAIKNMPPSDVCRDGHDARPVEGRPTGGGDGCRWASPKPCQPRPSGRATNRVLSPFFTRSRTLRFPSVRALATTSRTSFGVETDLPATSRITSPVEKP